MCCVVGGDRVSNYRVIPTLCCAGDSSMMTDDRADTDRWDTTILH